MGKEIVYCEICGARILEEEFQKARAITVLNKNYCAACKDEAVKNITMEDIEDDEPAPPARRPSGARQTTSRVTEKTKRKPSPEPRRDLAPKLALLGGAGIGLVSLVVLVVLIVSDRKTPVTPEGRPSSPSGPSKAEAAWSELERAKEAADRNRDEDAFLATVRRLEADLAATSRASQVRAWKEEYTKRKEARAALREAEAIVKEDPSFGRYPDVIAKLQSGLRAAPRAGPLAAEIGNVRRRYQDDYEAAARKVYREMIGQVQGHLRAGEYANAAAVIEARFPAALRRSKSWKDDLQKIYEECLRKKRG